MKKVLMKDKTINNYTDTVLEIKIKKKNMEQECLYLLFQEKIKQELNQVRIKVRISLFLISFSNM